MKYKKAKTAALVGLLILAEGTMNQGAINSSGDKDKDVHIEMSTTPSINAPKSVIDSIDAVLDTLVIPSETITKDVLRTKIFMHSKDRTYTPLYDSINNAIDTMDISSALITKDFIKSYFRTVDESISPYDSSQKIVRGILDTLMLGSELVDRKLRKSIAYVESRYHPDLVSPAGAKGTMQVMPKTWPAFSKEPYRLNVFKPEKNIPVGVQYLLFIEDFLSRNMKNWDRLSAERKTDLIAASFNGGHGLIYSVRGDITRTYKETREYVEKVKDAKLIISLEDALDFQNFPDTVYTYPERIKDVNKYLTEIETYLAKNYTGWKRADDGTKRDMIIAASVHGPRMLVKELKKPHKNKDWNFRYMYPYLASRISDFNSNQERLMMAKTWDYSAPSVVEIHMPKERIVRGLDELLSIEKKLSEKYGAWNLASQEGKVQAVLAASFYGVDNVLKGKMPEGSAERLKDASEAFRKYRTESQTRELIGQYFAFLPLSEKI